MTRRLLSRGLLGKGFAVELELTNGIGWKGFEWLPSEGDVVVGEGVNFFVGRSGPALVDVARLKPWSLPCAWTLIAPLWTSFFAASFACSALRVESFGWCWDESWWLLIVLARPPSVPIERLFPGLCWAISFSRFLYSLNSVTHASSIEDNVDGMTKRHRVDMLLEQSNKSRVMMMMLIDRLGLTNACLSRCVDQWDMVLPLFSLLSQSKHGQMRKDVTRRKSHSNREFRRKEIRNAKTLFFARIWWPMSEFHQVDRQLSVDWWFEKSMRVQR